MVLHTIINTKSLTAAKTLGAIKSIFVSHPVLIIYVGIVVKVCISYTGYRFLKKASCRDKNRIVFNKI